MKDVSILTNNGVDVKKSLELFGDMATYDQMLGEFLREVDNKLKEASRYKETGDMANYRVAVHSLKSDCRYFGLFALGDMFYEHELAAKDNNFYFVTEHFNELVSEATKMINVLKKYMGISVIEEVEDKPVTDNRVSILVVDDSNIIRTFIEKVFNDKYQVLVANDGDEAISTVASSGAKIACMFLDLNMPNVDGFQVLEYFRKNDLFSSIPVLTITGLADDGVINKAFTYPIVDVLRKPFNELTLKEAVSKALNR